VTANPALSQKLCAPLIWAPDGKSLPLRLANAAAHPIPAIAALRSMGRYKTHPTWGLTTMDKKQNLQDTFLNAVRKSKTPLTIFLVNGVKLQGVVTWFDNFCVLLRRDGQVQLVYKHAISTIMPGAPVQLFENEKTADEVDG
jgi:host factor-I protein